jgi:hypothetical protein
MRQKMDLLIRRMFGRSSEKMDANQLDLFLLSLPDESGKAEASSLQEADPVKCVSKGKPCRRRERWPEDLPVIEEVIDPKEVQEAAQEWRFFWSTRSITRVGDDGKVPVRNLRISIGAPPRSKVLRCLLPDGDIFFLKAPPTKTTLPTVLLHSPPF